ncbi:MAG TPA: hypothetical protein VHS52_06545 [Acidimicrobiales bacterium]|nr:hypothetical protein [Acidimicrobiales bacterium]
MLKRCSLFVVAVALVAAGCASSRGSTSPTTTAPPPSTQPAPTGPAPSVPPGPDIYAATAVGQLSPAVQGVPSRAYVPNSLADTLDVIDTSTYKVVGHYKVGRGPQHVTPSWDLKQLYVDNTAGDSLTPIDPMSGKPGTPFPVTDPYNLYFTPDGSKAIVVAERYRRLDFRDAHTWQVIKSVTIDHSGPDHLDFSADGTYFLISCEFSGWVVKVDVATMAVVSELHVGGEPIDTRLSPDGKTFYVANQGLPGHRDGVQMVDGATMQSKGFIPTGNGTHGLYFSRDARSLYATNRGGGTVSVIDVATNAVTATWNIPGGSPDMGGVSADGTQFWITGRNNGEVYVIDTRSGQLLHRIPVGKGPHGLALFPQPGRFSLGHTGNYR